MHSEREEYRDRDREDREDREDFDRFSFWKNNDSSTESYCNVCFHNYEKKQCHHDRIKCYECHKTEHVRRNCSKSRSLMSQSQDERKQIIDMIRNMIAQVSSIENMKFVDWILNFECTTHICNNRFRFINSMYKQHIKTVQMIIDQIVMFCDKESVEINLVVIEMKLLLKEVIHVLEMKHNYMSMNALSKRKLDVFFHHVQSRLMINNNVIEYIDKLINCYELYDIQEKEQKVMTFIKKSLDSAVWHDRTAHLSHWNMLKMRNLVKRMKKLKMSLSSEKICEFCMIERQQAEISRSSMTHVIKILKLLHLNLKDSSSIVWIDDYSYFLLIKNDFSLLIFVYSLKLKSETHHKLIEFKTLMKKQINMKVKRLQVNEEDEFRDHKWKNWCKETEIKLKSSALYISQQNEKTECSMYTFMISVRSILKEKKLSKALWLKLVKAVAYVKNRCSRVDEIILFQTDNEFQSDVSNLRALECKAWVHVSKITDHHKLDSRFWQDIMIDYEEMNQWQIYNSVNRKIHVFRDIKFDELNIYDSFFDEELGEIWNKEDDSLFNETTVIVNDLIIESSLEKSRYSTLIFNDATTLVEAETSKNIEEEKNNEKFNLLLHIFESSEHVISQRIMRSSTDKSVSKVTKNETAQKQQQQQKKQKKIRTQSKSKEKNVVNVRIVPRWYNQWRSELIVLDL